MHAANPAHPRMSKGKRILDPRSGVLDESASTVWRGMRLAWLRSREADILCWQVCMWEEESGMGEGGAGLSLILHRGTSVEVMVTHFEDRFVRLQRSCEGEVRASRT